MSAADIRHDFQLTTPMQMQSVEDDLDHAVVFSLCSTKQEPRINLIYALDVLVCQQDKERPFAMCLAAGQPSC